MLVDLVELRDRGVKLPREVVLAAAPLRGELSLSEGRPGWHSGQKTLSLLAGLVVPGKVEWAIAPLDYAWVKIIRMDNMVIVGIQQHSGSGRDKDIQAFPQAWWCRIVNAPATDRARTAARSTGPTTVVVET